MGLHCEKQSEFLGVSEIQKFLFRSFTDSPISSEGVFSPQDKSTLSSLCFEEAKICYAYDSLAIVAESG